MPSFLDTFRRPLRPALASVLSLVAIVAVSYPGPVMAQLVTANPLDELKAKVEVALQEAGVPFSQQQNRELALVLEEQRQASERLFGDIMDFSGGGPARGADRDRALAGIQWMNEAFEAKLAEVLTAEQNLAWTEVKAASIRAEGGFRALDLILRESAAALDATQMGRAAAVYEQAGIQLRQAGADASRAADIRATFLGRVVDLLTDGQAAALVRANAPNQAPAATTPARSADGPSEDPLRPERAAVVMALTSLAPPTLDFVAGGGSRSAQGASSDQIAQIRINNNAFTTENFPGRGGPGGGGPPGGFQGGGGGGGGRGGGGGGGGRGGGRGNSIEVIQRGGIGDFHGNASFDFRDEMLTARNHFADNKPPFQQRNINANVSGPFIRNLLTASLTFNQNEQENADTVVATTPSGLLSFGIVRPNTSRQYSGSGQMQLAASHALHFNARYSTRDSKNNGIGGYTLPERARTQQNTDSGFGLREIWSITPRTVHEVNFNHSGNDSAEQSLTQAVTINVLDAFQSGGGGRENWRKSKNEALSNLFWYEGDRLTFKTGAEFTYRSSSSFAKDGFLGQYTFSSLDAFVAGTPLTYRVTRGDPLIEVSQKEVGGFVQTDWRLTRRFTFFAGLRYEWQTNIDDANNFDPRFGFAYSLGSSTVLRGGAGLFHQNLNIGMVQDVLRLDGTRQYEIVVSNPTYPDPFAGGNATVVPPSSRRVFAPDLVVPYDSRVSLSVERSLPWNVQVDASWDYTRGYDRFRTRNLNAPLPGQTVRPNPLEGNVLQLESTARSESNSLRLALRQRLSFVTYNVSYTLSSDRDDSDGPFSLPMNNYDLGADWGRSGFSQRHRYNFTVNSEAPFGTYFTVNGFGSSGAPYTITTGKDDNGDQTTNDRPAGVPRNSATGPRFFNIDMTLSKTFRLQGTGGTAKQLSAYANMSNAFNFVNLRNPSGVLTSSYFGIPTSASAARDVELGVRFQF